MSGDRRLERVLMERYLDGSLLNGILIDAAELEPDDDPVVVECLLEGLLLVNLLEDANPDDKTWDDLMAELRAEATPEDLQKIAVRIEDRVVQLVRP